MSALRVVRRSLVGIAGVAVALVIAYGLDLGWGGAIAVVAACLAVFPLHLVIHEVGHLVAALVTGLRVRSVRISLWRQSAVVVLPAGPALPVRMVAFVLGGPSANIGAAALAWQLWRLPLPVPIRVAAAFAAGTGVLFGVVNLLPIRMPVSAPDPDGLNLMGWLFRPRLSTAATISDPARLDKIIETTGHPLVLLTAVLQRQQIDSGYSQLVPMAERLSAIAHDKRTKPAHASAIAAQLAVLFGMSYLHMGIVVGNAIDRDNADEIIEIAELGFRLRPKNERARIGLAIARLIDHRPAQARDLLASLRATTATTLALSTLVFAIAELYLGHRAKAASLASTLRDHEGQLLSALLATDALPRLVLDDPDAHAPTGSSSVGGSVTLSDGNPPASAASYATSASAPAGTTPVIAVSSPEGSTPLRP
jgi:hypothetical protein